METLPGPPIPPMPDMSDIIDLNAFLVRVSLILTDRMELIDAHGPNKLPVGRIKMMPQKTVNGRILVSCNRHAKCCHFLPIAPGKYNAVLRIAYAWIAQGRDCMDDPGKHTALAEVAKEEARALNN